MGAVVGVGRSRMVNDPIICVVNVDMSLVSVRGLASCVEGPLGRRRVVEKGLPTGGKVGFALASSFSSPLACVVVSGLPSVVGTDTFPPVNASRCTPSVSSSNNRTPTPFPLHLSHTSICPSWSCTQSLLTLHARLQNPSSGLPSQSEMVRLVHEILIFFFES